MAEMQLQLHNLQLLQHNLELEQLEQAAAAQQPQPARGLRDRTNPLEDYEDEPFRLRYRFTKQTTIYIVDLLREDLQRETGRNDPLPVCLQVLTALRFYAVGSFQRMHGDEAGISQSSVCRVVKDVSEAVARRKGQFMKFPTTRQEVTAIQQQFFQYCRFPGVIGAVDGTHVYIRSPGGAQAGYYINRKNRYSINVQVVCDHAGRITSIVARWPGSSHDARIFSECALKQELEARADGSELLLGDSGYPCLPFLMTPFHHPNGRPQVRFNTAHKKGRCVIERTFGQWKRRFPCLNDLRVRLDTVEIVIVAVSVLWNISIDHRERDVPGPEPEGMLGLNLLPPGYQNAVAGRLRRDQIVREHFTH